MCLAGASGAGAELLKAVPQAELRAYFVWVPMLPGDSAEGAAGAAARCAEGRARHYWDGERALSRRLAERARMGVEQAWDVYLAYGRGQADLAQPAFWMHQLPGVTAAARLHVAEWRRRVEELLRRATLRQAQGRL